MIDIQIGNWRLVLKRITPTKGDIIEMIHKHLEKIYPMYVRGVMPQGTRIKAAKFLRTHEMTRATIGAGLVKEQEAERIDMQGVKTYIAPLVRKAEFLREEFPHAK